MPRKANRKGQKQCPQCKTWIKGTRTKECLKCGYKFNGKQDAAPAPVVAPAEKPVKAGDAITISQLRAVMQSVKAAGGVGQVNELLGVVRDTGGLKKFRELLEVVYGTE